MIEAASGGETTRGVGRWTSSQEVAGTTPESQSAKGSLACWATASKPCLSDVVFVGVSTSEPSPA